MNDGAKGKTNNLISMTANIINIENKLSSLLGSPSEKSDQHDDPLASMKAAFNLINIANDVRKTESPKVALLTQIASEIRDTEDPKTSSLTQIASEIKSTDPKVGILTAIAAEIRQGDG